MVFVSFALCIVYINITYEMSPNQIHHCCVTNNCTGETYLGWNFCCRFCHNEIMIECLRSQDESRTKTILQLFGLIKQVTLTNGSIGWEVVNNPESFSMLKKIFNENSPFGLACQRCAAKFDTNGVSINESAASTDTDVSTNANRTSNALNSSINLMDMSIVDFQEGLVDSIRNVVKELIDNPVLPDSKVTIRKRRNVITPLQAESSSSHDSTHTINDSVSPISQIVTPVNGIFAIHISKASKDATIDDIIALIMSKSNLSAASFKVETLRNRRFKGNNREFSSFKISTLTRETFDTILDANIWKPDLIAKPFVYNNLLKKPNTSNTVNTQKDGKSIVHQPKGNKQNSKSNSNDNRNNISSHRYQARFSPRSQRQQQQQQHKQYHHRQHQQHQQQQNQQQRYHQHQNQNWNLQKQIIQPQCLPNNNYSFWNGTPHHIVPPQMYVNNMLPYHMMQPFHSQQMFQPF